MCECVLEKKLTVIHHRGIRFAGTFNASFSYELHASKRLNRSKLQGSKIRKRRSFCFDRCSRCEGKQSFLRCAHVSMDCESERKGRRCDLYALLGGRLHQPSPLAQAVLIIIIIHFITFPFTAVLNTLVMLAMS